MPTQEQLNIATDRKRLIETVVQIEDKDRRLVPFILNPIQADMESTSGTADVYLKPAQVGATSYFICDFLLDCITIPGTTAVIISYDEFITGRLLRKAQSFYDNLYNLIPSIPEMKHKSTFEKTFVFEDSRGVKHGESSMYIASARGFSMPRGEPIHDLLLDEFGFWPPGAGTETFAATLNRVPLLPSMKRRILSTPNGEDNDFCEVYMAAKEGKEFGKSVFQHHFYTWYQHPEYRLAPDNPYVLPGDSTPILSNLDTDESVLMLRFEQLGMDIVEANDRIRWRRYKMAEMQSLKRSGETRLLFPQEFPEDDVTCFQSAGDMWYDHEQINDLARGCYEAPFHKVFADIWFLPEDGHKYLVAIDPGEGKKSVSVATVWEIFGETLIKHCATLSGLYDQPTMAEKSKAFAVYYNDAVIANEDALGFTGYISNYPDLYYRTDPDTGKVGRDIGWQTNPATKIYMCNELCRLLPVIECHDIRVIEQCRNIKELKSRGRLIPTSVGADDYHDSMCIAIVCRTAMPLARGFVDAKGWGDDWGK